MAVNIRQKQYSCIFNVSLIDRLLHESCFKIITFTAGKRNLLL